MDRLVSVDVKEVEIYYRSSQRCASATFRITNLMHTMAVAVQLTTTRPALFSPSPKAATVLAPLVTASFTLLLPPTDRPPLAVPPDALVVRSALLPTGKAGTAAVVRLFSRPGVHVFRDASLPICIMGPHVLPALLLLPSPESLETAFLLSKALSVCTPTDLPEFLRRAAATGNHRFVSAFLRAGANPESRWPDGKSALSLAVASGSAEAVRALLNAGARYDPALDRPVHEAAAANRTDLIALLSTKAPPGSPWADAADQSGRTPVHAAAATGCLEALRLCLDTGGGDPDRTDNRGWTPLHCAAAGGHVEVAELLVNRSAYDAKRVVTGDERKTPFGLAADGGFAHLYNLLHLGDALHAAASSGDVDGMQECLSMGVEVNSRDQNGWTALHRAAFKGQIEVVTALIEHGAELDAVDGDGYTALRCAVEAGHADVALCLVAHGARAAGLKGIIRGADYVSRMVNKWESCCSGKAGMGMGSPMRREMRKLRLDIS